MLSLFDETALFNTGKKRFTSFDIPDARLQLWEQFFEKDESDHYYEVLLHNSPWQQRERKMYDKIIPDPRLTAWYGPGGLPFTAELLTIKSKVEAQCDISFDSVLLNLYRDGRDSVSWHSDTSPADGIHKPIASVSFGETRPFQVKHKTRKDLKMMEIPLTHGSFLLMGAGMQDNYEHHIPKTARQIAPRIN
ncbi:MAG TPA: alpha-ketoglutarate-dependent dioxygenase AlkB, partial [Flavitalea sp.]|nr:alpha-ketoglutarate-dependent dioxygenase AlkB [Flavitalea sp.]